MLQRLRPTPFRHFTDPVPPTNAEAMKVPRAFIRCRQFRQPVFDKHAGNPWPSTPGGATGSWARPTCLMSRTRRNWLTYLSTSRRDTLGPATSGPPDRRSAITGPVAGSAVCLKADPGLESVYAAADGAHTCRAIRGRSRARSHPASLCKE